MLLALSVEMKALAERERGDVLMAMALSETVAVSSVHRILFCGGVWNSWHLLTGGVCNISLFFFIFTLFFQLKEWVLQVHSSVQNFHTNLTIYS